jgi:hypothetical protein
MASVRSDAISTAPIRTSLMARIRSSVRSVRVFAWTATSVSNVFTYVSTPNDGKGIATKHTYGIDDIGLMPSEESINYLQITLRLE